MPAVQHPRVWLVLWCGPSVLRHRASCFSTQSCAPTITCSNTGCGAGSTCCVDGSTLQPFCAQGTNVTCCGSEQMTCEAGTICDPVGGPCVTPSPEPTEWCTDCQALVKFLEKKGCAAIDGPCDGTFSPLVCLLIEQSGLCDYIVDNALPPLNACEMVGVCGTGSCPCGYCNPTYYGQWCLTGAQLVPFERKNGEDDHVAGRRPSQQRLLIGGSWAKVLAAGAQCRGCMP